MRSTRLLTLLAGAAFALAAAGCGGPKVYPVSGTVKFEGKPMKGGGSITFVPTGKQEGKTGGGLIAEDGTYTLTSYKPGDGSMAGEFRVVITQVTEQEGKATGDGEKSSRSVSVVAKEDRIPEIYGDTFKSPLTAKVEAKENKLDFDLKRDAGGQPVQGARRGDREPDPFGPFAPPRFPG